jgi:hypothetical protein
LYPSCADTSVLTVKNDDRVSEIPPGYLRNPLEVGKMERVTSLPPRILKSIAELPSKNEKFVENFSGEHTPSKTSPIMTLNSISVEALLPIHQHSPVFKSGESSQITKHPNIKQLCTNNQKLKYPNALTYNTETSDWFLPMIAEIINTKIEAPSHPLLKFKLSSPAADYNMSILKSHGNSIQNLIAAYPHSFISPGLEFCPAHLLEKLFMHHHNWHLIQKSLSGGSKWPLLPIEDKERVARNIEFIARENHKSALKYEDEYIKIVEAEINQGWMFPLPLHLHGALSFSLSNFCKHFLQAESLSIHQYQHGVQILQE